MYYTEKMLVALIATIAVMIVVGLSLLMLHGWRISEDKRDCRNSGGIVKENAEGEWFCSKQTPEKVF